MKHPFANRLICIDDYFEEPEKVNRIFDKQKFYRMSMYPGYRTDILYNSEDNETKEFAIDFIESLKERVFPGISNYITSLHFHRSEEHTSELQSH